MMQSSLPEAENNSLSYSFPARFVAVYLVLQIIPFPLSSIHYFSFFTDASSRIFNVLVVWTGQHIFRLPHFIATSYNGSGDRLFNYIWLFVIAMLALLLGFVWQFAKKDKDRDRIIFYWLTAYIQFYFALTMMHYGLEKVIQMQFPFPYASLTQTYGQSSPMQLMWSFIGYSKAYNLILGITEMISGFLVLFGRTKLAGALLGIGIMSHVLILNFCYDVPVKLFAINFLLTAVFIVAPDIKRLLYFFLLNKTVLPKPLWHPKLSQKTWQWLLGIKYLVAIVVFCFGLQWVRLKYSTWGNGAFKQTPLFGIYQVTAFVKNGDTLPPIQTDTARWKKLSVIYRKEAIVNLMNDSIRNYRFITDTVHQSIEIGKKGDSTTKSIFSYSQPSAMQLLLKGKWQHDSLHILLQKQDMNEYLLINRGFHWISEYPLR